MPFLVPVAALILGFALGHWLAIPLATLVWFVGFFFLAFTWEGGGSMADFQTAVLMLPASYVAAGIGAALRRFVRRRSVAT